MERKPRAFWLIVSHEKEKANKGIVLKFCFFLVMLLFMAYNCSNIMC